MLSSELARLAGVSVRALRHYHQVGLLDEPRRSSNGYRHYDVHHLIRVLRVRRLASVGIPLDRMTPLLDGAPDDAGGLLDDLDRELADQAQRLARQRALVARLRADRTPPDLPPELGRSLAAFAATEISADRVRTDHDEVVLLAHLAGEDGLPHLARLYQRLADPGLIRVVNALTERFDRLGPGSTDQDVDAFAEGVVATLAPVFGEYAGAAPLVDVSAAAGLISEYTSDRYNERQRRALALIDALLDQS